MKKVLKIIVDVLAWVVLILAFLVTLMVFASERNDGVASILGFMPMSVQSNSMSPTFDKGDLIIVKKVDDLYNLKENDVITYYTIVDGYRIVNTHRIARIEETDGNKAFITRGDNNPADDEVPAYPSDIVGQWTGARLKGVGKFFDFLKTKKGFFICVVIPIAIFFIFELYKFIMTIIETKRGMTEEDEEEIKRKAVEEYLAAQKAKEGEGAAEDAAEAVEETAEEAAETAEEAVEEAEEAVAEAESKGSKAADKLKAIKNEEE